ncbi:acyl carrier protein [Falsiroseomonas sp.]|uniref:acyl carrier protein n=1 Tax=Falsiroseomonas sp. TaxID=2870721 RepID=UPI00273325BB|nr:acyl carrier protein [Falsiroseomonas sp.]MDP3416504.1 acyl carrier protein [Falsiroseomonas sp.]
MPAFTLADLQAIAREVIGDREIALSPEMEAADVPGWDSLNHTLISVEIESQTGAAVDAQQLAQCPTFGDLVAFVAARLPG